MILKYFINQLIINEKYKRTQTTTWAQQKQYLFEIIQDLQPKNIYAKAQMQDPNYNVLNNFHGDERRSLCVLPIEANGNLYQQKIFTGNLQNIQNLNNTNYSTASNRYAFFMCLIDNDDAELFEEGNIEQIYDHDADKNSGILKRTAFVIYVDDGNEKIYIVKQAGFGTIGIKAFEDYIDIKSPTYRGLKTTHSMKFIPLPSDEEFSPQDISELKEMAIAVDGETLEEYREVNGNRDAFLTVIRNLIPEKARIGKKIEIKIKFQTEGNEDAVGLFDEVYTSFNAELAEAQVNLMNKFTIDYNSNRTGTQKHLNFKQRMNFFYEIEITGQGLISHINNTNNAFNEILVRDNND